MDKKEKYATLKSRFLTVQQVLADPKYLEYFIALPFNSGYFMCVELNYQLNAEAIRKILLDKYSTGVIVFENLIRLAFSAVPQSKIQELIENIYLACKDYSEQK